MSNAELSPADPASRQRELRADVERFDVRFNVTPEYVYVNDERRSVGWIVELSASHGPGTHYPTPGCAACAPVERALAALMEAVVPRDHREAYYECHVLTAQHSLSHARANRPEMTARISILHREGVGAPIDDCETRCLHEVVENLRSLHVHEGR